MNTKQNNSLARETLAAQALGDIDPVTQAIIPPLHLSTTYQRDPDGQYPAGHSYTRADNPTYDTPETLLAALDQGDEALLFSSGMSAAVAVLQSLKPGDHVLAPRVMYWGLRQWMLDFAVPWGLNIDFIDTTDLVALDKALRPGRTRIVWLETPANPTWEITDIAAVSECAHGAGAQVVVDNTVATPVLTQPLTLGADRVVYSATKYLNGHSDVLAGAVVTAQCDAFWERLKMWRHSVGAVPGPFESWLLLRGMRTLFVRVRHSSASAMTLARHFQGHPALNEVLYPGLASHPNHAIAAQQMSGSFGGMFSIRIKGGRSQAIAVAAALRVFKRATSLGGVESLVEHRASIEGPETPVPDDLLRFSVGLEKVDDLMADLEQALR